MRDSYTNNRAIAVGPSSGASGTFVDNSSQVAGCEVPEPEAGKVADDEASDHDGAPGPMRLMGRWALDVAKEIGTEVVTKTIERSLGLPHA